MSAAADDKKILASCLRLVNDLRGNDESRRIAVQSAYELGVASGRLAGKIELSEQLFKTGAA